MQQIYNDIYSCFLHQVNVNENSIAIRSNTDSITYGNLNRKASIVSNYLIKNGYAGLENVIGVMLPRSIEFIAAIFGILKTGSIYLPIDVDTPSSRKKYMLNDSKAKFTIDKSTKFDFSTITEDSYPKIHPENIAYVIYTSGSTGKQKPVAVTHRGVLNLISTYRDIKIQEVYCNTNFCFDVSVFEIFLPLLTGATLVLLNKEEVALKEEFEKNVGNSGMILLTYSVFESLVNQKCNFDNIDYLLVGGERFNPAILSKLTSYPKHLINSYGPTENTVISLNYEINIQDKEVPLGFSINNTNAFILNDKLDFAHEGEIALSGNGLARGYLNDPVLTAEKFIANPFGNGDRLYKTGDLGKSSDSGAISFLGREDSQVKLRGHRIELTEIEKDIESCGETERCVVLVNNVEGADILTAYVVSNLSEFEILDVLSQNLPNYMIPQDFIFLEKIPLNQNGKIDYVKLRTLHSERKKFVSPTTTEEILIHKIFSDVLRKEKISIDDDFFKIGGDSILAMQLVAKAKKQNVFFNVKDVFELKTIRNIAQKILLNGNLIPPEKILRKSAFSMTPWQSFLFQNGAKRHCVIKKNLDSEDVPTIRNNLNKLNITHRGISIAHSDYEQKYSAKTIPFNELIVTQKNCDFTKLFSKLPLQVLLVKQKGKHHILITADSVLFDDKSFDMITDMLLNSKIIPQSEYSFAQFVDALYKQSFEEFVFENKVNNSKFDDFSVLHASIPDVDLNAIRENSYFSAEDFFLAVVLMSVGKHPCEFAFLKNIRNNFSTIDLKHTLGNFDHIFYGHTEERPSLPIMSNLTDTLQTIKSSEQNISRNIRKCDLFFSYNPHIDFYSDIANINIMCHTRDNSVDLTVFYNDKFCNVKKLQSQIKTFDSLLRKIIEKLNLDRSSYIFDNLIVSDTLSLVTNQKASQILFFLPPISRHPFPYLVLSQNEIFQAANIDVYAIGDLEFGYDMNNCSNLIGLAHKFARLIKGKTKPSDQINLAGWCFGGYLAFEITRILINSGYSVNKTILIDSPDPQTSVNMDQWSDQEIRCNNKFFEENGILQGTFSERQIIDNLKKNNHIASIYAPVKLDHPIELILAQRKSPEEISKYWTPLTSKLRVHETSLIHSEIFDLQNVDYISNLIKDIIIS